ncbi:acyl-CoA dehydrogenase family protein [Aquihabitans sp. McL0605]|uniref:acyl-CoA dehydrogenase family protein n=1 Tax=Aquihabitans sp. McL0605 TaxID=3415671 RepID=UPI003CE86B07
MTDLSEHHDELRQVARDLLAASPDGDPGWAQLAELGWIGLEVPEALDGSGATFAETAIVLEELGRAASTTAFFGTAVLGVGALAAVAPTDQRDQLLRQVAAGQRTVAVALTAGGDEALAAPPFSLERTDGGLRLHGRAEFVVDAAEADDLLLLATHPGDPAAPGIAGGSRLVLVRVAPFLVEVDEVPVVDATRRFGTVAADRVEIDDDAVWAFTGDGGAAAQRVLDRAAVAVACDAMGLAGAMLDAMVAYLGERRQFGRQIGSFQAVKHACADLLVELTIGRELLTAAVAASAAGDVDAGRAASRAASFVTAAAVDVVGEALQLHGAMGYSWESGLHVYLKRAILDRSLYGSPAAHRRRLAALLIAARPA